MNDPHTQPVLSIDPGFEAEAETYKDRGEATPLPPKSEIEIAAEQQERVKAGFKIVSDIRENVIALGAMTKSEADSFQLLDVAPKAESIVSRYKFVTQEIADKQDSAEEVKQLKEEQAELYLAYSYNTVALLKTKFAKKMSEIFTGAHTQISENLRPDQELVDQVQQMLGVATQMESFRANTEQLVPDLVTEYPQLQVACDALNADLLKCLGETNQLKQSSDQSSKELGRFVAELQDSISYKKIEELSSILQDQAKRHTETAQDTTGMVSEPSLAVEPKMEVDQTGDDLLQRVDVVEQQSGVSSDDDQLRAG